MKLFLLLLPLAFAGVPEDIAAVHAVDRTLMRQWETTKVAVAAALEPYLRSGSADVRFEAARVLRRHYTVIREREASPYLANLLFSETDARVVEQLASCVDTPLGKTVRLRVEAGLRPIDLQRARTILSNAIRSDVAQFPLQGALQMTLMSSDVETVALGLELYRAGLLSGSYAHGTLLMPDWTEVLGPAVVRVLREREEDAMSAIQVTNLLSAGRNDWPGRQAALGLVTLLAHKDPRTNIYIAAMRTLATARPDSPRLLRLLELGLYRDAEARAEVFNQLALLTRPDKLFEGYLRHQLDRGYERSGSLAHRALERLETRRVYARSDHPDRVRALLAASENPATPERRIALVALAVLFPRETSARALFLSVLTEMEPTPSTVAESLLAGKLRADREAMALALLASPETPTDLIKAIERAIVQGRLPPEWAGRLRHDCAHALAVESRP